MNDMTKTSLRSRLIRLLPLIVLLAVAAAGLVFLFRGDLSFERLFEILRDYRTDLLALRDENYVRMALAFVTAYTLMAAFSLPGAVVASLTGGFLFGIFPGALFNVGAATIGACIIFSAARWGFGDRLAAKMEASEGAAKRIKKGIDENQWSMLFLIRLVPAFPFFIANLVPAFVGVPLWRFAVTTFLGIIPAGVVYTAVGAGLGEVFDRGETPDPNIIFSPEILLPILGLCALAALPIVVKALRGTRKVDGSDH